MIRKHQQLLAVLAAAADGLLLVCAYVLAAWLWLAVFKQDSVNMAAQPDSLPIACLYAALVVLIQVLLGCYDFSRTRRLRSMLPACWLANLTGILCGMSVMYLLRMSEFSRGVTALFFAFGCLLTGIRLLLTRRLLHTLRLKGYNRWHVLVAGTGKNAARYMESIRSHPELGLNLMGCVGPEDRMNVPHLGALGDLFACMERLRPDEVVIALDEEQSAQTGSLIMACERAGIRCSVVPAYAELIPHGVTMESIDETRLLSLRSNPLDNVGCAFLKRSFDVAVSALLLILLTPLLLVCALGVRLSGKGPVFFRQERVGLNRRSFTMLKLRSMRVGSDQDTGWTTGDDPRRTRFGALMRKLSIDELPQLLNVLRGDMSLVGPRPEVPFYVEKYAREVPRYMVKHQVRPGITGWAQVNGWRGDTSINERIAHDVWYIEHWSPLLDLRILLRTAMGGFVNEEKLPRRKKG